MEADGQANSLKNKKKDSNDTKDNLWSTILEEVQNQGNTKLPSNKNILVLGDNETGKTTLIAKLQGVEDPKKGSALEYAYIDVRDEYRDEHTRLSVWVLDGEAQHGRLLRFALNEDTFEHTLVVLTVAATAPWALLDQLQRWADLLRAHIDGMHLDPEVLSRCKRERVRSWVRYTEPGDEVEAGGAGGAGGALPSPLRAPPASPAAHPPPAHPAHLLAASDDEDDELALPEHVLTDNLGLDMVVVLTKTDYMSTLEKEHDYRDEHFDFVQASVRRFCLRHGAALFYTSAKEDKNCDLLYKYLTHRIYRLAFRTPALIVEKDAVLIPAGWDSIKKISILYENMHSCKPDDYYNDVIVQPATRKAGGRGEAEVVAEEEQAFLARALAALQAGGGAGAPGGTGAVGPGGVGATPASPATPTHHHAAPARAPSPMRTPQTPRSHAQLDGKLGVSGAGNEGVLANFFNSLLNKKAASPGGVGGGGGGGTGPAPRSLDPPPAAAAAAARSDAAAELDRLTRANKLPHIDLDSSTDC